LSTKTGLKLTPKQFDELRGAYPKLKSLTARLKNASRRVGGTGIRLFRQRCETMTTDPTLLTIAEASALFESKQLSPVELTKACIAKDRGARSDASELSQVHPGDGARVREGR